MANVRKIDGRYEIWDVMRRKWVAYTPEEGVRQWLAEYLVSRGVEHWRMAAEYMQVVDGRRLRLDILVYNKRSQPVMICECKAPEIPVNDGVFMQAANYNRLLRVPYLLVTNGNVLYCARVDVASGSYEFLDTIPDLGE